MGIDPLRGDCVVFRIATVFRSQDLRLVRDQRFRIIRTQDDSEKKKENQTMSLRNARKSPIT